MSEENVHKVLLDSYLELGDQVGGSTSPLIPLVSVSSVEVAKKFQGGLAQISGLGGGPLCNIYGNTLHAFFVLSKNVFTRDKFT